MDIDIAIKMLRERNEPVPIPPRLPTEVEVEAAEKRIGRRFPPDFKRFLLEAGDVVCDMLEPVSVTNPEWPNDIAAVLDHARAFDLPDDLLPICEDNADFYCLNPRGEVVFWDHNGSSSEKWPSLADWIVTVWIERG